MLCVVKGPAQSNEDTIHQGGPNWTRVGAAMPASSGGGFSSRSFAAKAIQFEPLAMMGLLFQKVTTKSLTSCLVEF